MGDFWVVTPNCGALALPLILAAGGDHTIREISTLLLFPPLSLGHFLPVSSPSPQSRPHSMQLEGRGSVVSVPSGV